MIYATITHHNELLSAIRRRRDELGITNETLEAIAGLQVGYASKILADPPGKRMGPFTLFLIADALGLSLAFVENPDMVAKMATRYTKRRINKPIPSAASIVEITREQFRLIGRRGGLARARKLSPKQLSAIGIRANRVRWERARQKQNVAKATNVVSL